MPKGFVLSHHFKRTISRSCERLDSPKREGFLFFLLKAKCPACEKPRIVNILLFSCQSGLLRSYIWILMFLIRVTAEWVPEFLWISLLLMWPWKKCHLYHLVLLSILSKLQFLIFWQQYIFIFQRNVYNCKRVKSFRFINFKEKNGRKKSTTL